VTRNERERTNEEEGLARRKRWVEKLSEEVETKGKVQEKRKLTFPIVNGRKIVHATQIERMSVIRAEFCRSCKIGPRRPMAVREQTKKTRRVSQRDSTNLGALGTERRKEQTFQNPVQILLHHPIILSLHLVVSQPKPIVLLVLFLKPDPLRCRFQLGPPSSRLHQRRRKIEWIFVVFLRVLSSLSFSFLLAVVVILSSNVSRNVQRCASSLIPTEFLLHTATELSLFGFVQGCEVER